MVIALLITVPLLNGTVLLPLSPARTTVPPCLTAAKASKIGWVAIGVTSNATSTPAPRPPGAAGAGRAEGAPPPPPPGGGAPRHAGAERVEHRRHVGRDVAAD